MSLYSPSIPFDMLSRFIFCRSPFYSPPLSFIYLQLTFYKLVLHATLFWLQIFIYALLYLHMSPHSLHWVAFIIYILKQVLFDTKNG